MNESLAYDVFCLDSYLKYSDSIGNKKLSSKLSTLKKSMVITSEIIMWAQRSHSSEKNLQVSFLELREIQVLQRRQKQKI